MGANSGNTLCTWEGYEAIRIPNNGTDTHLRGIPSTIPHNVLGFNGVGYGQTHVRIAGVMPRHYTSGGVYVVWWFVMATAVSGGTVWFGRIGRKIATGMEFGQYTSAVPSSPSVAGAPAYGVFYFPHLIGAGEYFQIQMVRDPDNPYATSPGVAEILGVELREV